MIAGVFTNLLNENANPNAKCLNQFEGYTDCHSAAFFSKMDISLEFHSDHVSEDWYPLHAAAFRAHVQSVDLLLKAGADPNICDNKGRTALDVAGLAHCCGITTDEDNDNFIRVIRLIKNKGGLHNTMREGGVNDVHTPLHTAVILQNMDALEELLKTASLACWDFNGLTPLHLCVNRRMEDVLRFLVGKGPDVKDRAGRTLVYASVCAKWHQGVSIALAAGADVTLKANDGETPLHAAADIDPNWSGKRESKIILNEILTVAKRNNVVDCLNEKGMTALFKAIRKRNIVCVEKLLQAGASIYHIATDNLNVFHVAAECGNEFILATLINSAKINNKLTEQGQAMINSLTNPVLEGFAPIHFAVSKNNLECVRILQAEKANLVLESTAEPHGSTTPLHIAAANENLEVAKCILGLHFDECNIGVNLKINPAEKFDGRGWLPLHCAIYKGSDAIIKLLLKNKTSIIAQVKGSEKPINALDMIMKYITNPTEYLEDFLDSFITLDEKTSNVKIDYQLLLPERSTIKEMAVIEAIIKTDDNFEQKKLLNHPLIESFIYFKWRAVMPLNYVIALMYAIFFIALAFFEATVYTIKDKPWNNGTNPEWSGLVVAECSILYFFVSIIFFIELLLMKVEGIYYFTRQESFIKLFTVGLGLSVPPAVMVQKWEKDEWPRHLATVTLFMACYQILTITSQLPSWGCYVVMFKKVATNVLQILVTFSVLIITFAISFMIQFRSGHPFDGPWDAFVKTLFLLTAEFEYNSVFSVESAKTIGYSFQIARIIFVVFLILAAIVLMNTMVGVAVDDINNLTTHGKIGELEKQAKCVKILDGLDDCLKEAFSLWCTQEKYARTLFPSTINLEGESMNPKPNYSDRIMPKRFRDAFSNIAQKNKKNKDKQLSKEFETLKEEREDIFRCRLMEKLDELGIQINNIAIPIVNTVIEAFNEI